MRMMKPVVAWLLVLCIAVGLFTPVRATDGTIPGEDAHQGLECLGVAKCLEDGTVELTPLATWQAGGVWYKHQLDAISGFELSFEYWAGGGREDYYGGADGIVLTISEKIAIGQDGEYLGFVEGSYGVELDSYPENGGDPEGKHIAIIQNTVSNHIAYKLDDRVDDSQWHTLKVTYDAEVLTVYLDDEQVLSQDNVVLPDEVYLGISAATGAGKNHHLIRNFYIHGIVSSGGEFAEDQDPIIIIPGIMGSRLFTSDTEFNNTTRVWDPVVVDMEGETWQERMVRILLNIYLLESKLKVNIGDPLYPRPCENQQNYPAHENGAENAALYGREYGALYTYKNTVDTLCDAFPDRPVYVFSYDWRMSNDISARRLAAEIEKISKEHDSKVDLVCHSMGGLVASSYYAQYGEEKVDQIITCGTPYEGAPKLLNSVLTKQVLDDPRTDFALWAFGGLTTDTKASFDGVAQLIPTYQYSQEFPMYKDQLSNWDKYGYELSYQEFAAICKKVFSETRYSKAAEFQQSIRTNKDADGYNVLYDYENAYFVVGKNHPTISSIQFEWHDNGVEKVFSESDLAYTFKGDGTVPYYSATIGERLFDSDRCITMDVNHMETITNDDCLEWIVEVLRRDISMVQSEPTQERQYVVIRVACPVDVTITRADETLYYEAENNKICSDASFGRMDILGENDEIKMFCLEMSDDYEILLEGTAEGSMDYSVCVFDEKDEMLEERIFQDVPLNENTVIVTDIDATADTQLDVDHNGDGIADEVWIAGAGDWVTVPDAERVPMSGISLGLDRDSLCVGESGMLSVTALPVETTDRFAVSYASSNEEVVKVSADGMVTGMKPGYAIITVTTTNGITDTIKVQVGFDDVEQGSFYYQPVYWAVENNITTGTSATTFNPNGQCQRAQVVTFLWRAAGCPEPTATENPFVDVKEGDFFHKAVLWAVEKGITNGIDATHFGPNESCNRAQVVTFLYRAMQSPAISTLECPFTDVEPGQWYEPAVLWAVEKGITNGLSADTFGVDTICNRAQVVTFLHRTYVN